jgi:hypothetical protein
LKTLNRSGPATDITIWVAAGIPLRPGRILAMDIVPMTNVVTVTASGTSGCDLYGGSTTFNASFRVVQVPIRHQSSVAGSQVYPEWTGVAPSFVVQRTADLGLAEWVDLMSTSQTNLIVTRTGNLGFYWIKLP